MSDQPHVLFVTVDQRPAHLLGCMGHPDIETPTLDMLARSDTLYRNCYAETPISIPSRRSMMTGLTARGHANRDFQPALRMSVKAQTLAGAFSTAGHRTGTIGKLHVYPPRDRIGRNATSDRLVALHDLMPTMLDMAGVAIPEGVKGCSLLAPDTRGHLYGENQSGAKATRMIRDRQRKLIWYTACKRFQLFDMMEDQREGHDLAADARQAETPDRLKALLRGHLYGSDLGRVDGDGFVGLHEPADTTPDNRGLSRQRGLHYPQVPASDPAVAMASA